MILGVYAGCRIAAVGCIFFIGSRYGVDEWLDHAMLLSSYVKAYIINSSLWILCGGVAQICFDVLKIDTCSAVDTIISVTQGTAPVKIRITQLLSTQILNILIQIVFALFGISSSHKVQSGNIFIF